MTKKEELAKVEERNAKRLKDEMQAYISQTKPDRDVEKKERQDVVDFISQDPVVALFKKYEGHKQDDYKSG